VATRHKKPKVLSVLINFLVANLAIILVKCETLLPIVEKFFEIAINIDKQARLEKLLPSMAMGGGVLYNLFLF